MTILCATDFSPASRAAAALGAALARRLGDSLCLVNVAELAVASPHGGTFAAASLERAIAEAAEAALDDEARQLRDRGTTVETRLLRGKPAPAIVELAAALQPRLIVVGSHGRRGMARFFLGSVAAALLDTAPAPLLVTPNVAIAAERWAGHLPLQLHTGVDRTHAARAAVEWLRREAPALSAEPTMLLLSWPPQDALRYGIEEIWAEAGGPHPALVTLLVRDLRKQLGQEGSIAASHVRVLTAHVDGAEVLARHAEAMSADALVVGIPRGRMESWNGLQAKAVLRASHLPVFCIPDQALHPVQATAPIRSLLVATDLGNHSSHTVALAYRLLAGGGGHVVLCHVHERLPTKRALLDLPLAPVLAEDERARLNERLHALIPEDAASRSISTAVEVVEGERAADAILKIARRLDVDMIALGTRGEAGISRSILGSVAEDVARRAPCPVALLPS